MSVRVTGWSSPQHSTRLKSSVSILGVSRNHPAGVRSSMQLQAFGVALSMSAYAAASVNSTSRAISVDVMTLRACIGVTLLRERRSSEREIARPAPVAG